MLETILMSRSKKPAAIEKWFLDSEDFLNAEFVLKKLTYLERLKLEKKNKKLTYFYKLKKAKRDKLKRK